jgi:deazaflavin-dependent oxidoreductase (nitroreductase family)
MPEPDGFGGRNYPSVTPKPYRLSPGRRLINLVVRPLARLGLTGPRTHLLTVPGRRTGKLWSTPVSIVAEGGDRWLVAPYGDRNWVKNARAAGSVELRRGRRRRRTRIEEVPPDERAPILREYVRTIRANREFFDAGPEDPVEAFAAEAAGHPVFRIVD